MKPSGIKGLTAKEPIGVVATIGHKGERGQPTDTDRFFLVQATAEKVGQIEIRPPHPAFRSFNSADPLDRQVLRGNLVHRTSTECWEHHLTAQLLPRLPMHPARAPHCTGDGVRAQRWDGQVFQSIGCPNELCEYRQGDKKPCGAFGRVLFRLRWKEGSPLPSLLCKLTTKSWHSVAAWLGFFREVEEQARILGGDLGIYGVPFVISLSKKTMASRGRAFPVLSISVDGDLQAFFVQRASHLRAAQLEHVAPLAALTDGEQQAPEVIAEDIDTITPGISVPAERTT